VRHLLLVLALLPSLVLGQVLRRDTGSGTFATAPTFPGATSTGTIQTKGLVSTALETPVNATFTAGAGTLTTATYSYRVVAKDAAGGTIPSTATSLAITGPAGVNVNWGAVPGATSYDVYGRSGTLALMANVLAPATTWLDAGSVTPSGVLPTAGTSGNISTVSSVTARDMATTAASGNIAIQVVSGSKICVDAGTNCIEKGTGNTVLVSSIRSQAAYHTGIYANGSVPIELHGSDVSDGYGKVVQIYPSTYSLTTAGDLILTGAADTSNTVKFSFDKDGMLRFGIANTSAAPTCDATQRGKIWIVNGGAGVTDTVTLCLKAAADTYSWVALATGG
jgi:hypothetical protein